MPLTLYSFGNDTFREFTVLDLAHISDAPRVRSKPTKIIPAGTRVIARGWVEGDEMDGDNRWLMLATRTTQYIHALDVREDF